MKHVILSMAAAFLAHMANSQEPAGRPSSASFPVAISPAEGLQVWLEDYMLDTATGTHRLISVSLDSDQDGVIDTSVGFTRIITNGATILVVENIKPEIALRTDGKTDRKDLLLNHKRPEPEHPENAKIRVSDGYKLILRLLQK
jgi:hypothetical protein